jgi:putative alpha-1,2-mannosidase
MVGSPTAQVLAESWLKGLRGFDAETAWAYSYANATGPTPPQSRTAIEGYAERGWVSAEEAGGSAALTLEYAWNDAALAAWGEGLGKDAEAEVVGHQARWEELWDPAQQFVVARGADGLHDVDPLAWEDDYVEGDAWQYVWMVPQDVDALIEVQHGGDRDAFLDRVDGFWTETYAAADTAFPDPYYWHGNEPDIHYAYLASLAGVPERSAKPIRWIRDHKYALDPAGLDGNDDGGTLSA